MKFDSMPQPQKPAEGNQSQIEKIEKQTSGIKKWLTRVGLVGAALGTGVAGHAQEAKTIDQAKTPIVAENKIESNERATEKNLEDWNGYLALLSSKHLRGDASLNKDNLGKKMLEEYIKDNPSTSLSEETVKLIQKEISTHYKDWVVKRWKANTAMIGDKMFDPKNPTEMATIEANFMVTPLIEDGYGGEETTKVSFDQKYIDEVKREEAKTISYAQAQKIHENLNAQNNSPEQK
jgi:hypothetical protein